MAEPIANPTHQDFTEQFWTLLEKNMGCLVPSYVKHILRIRGYDNPASIGTLTANDVENIQEYFRKKIRNSGGQTLDINMLFHSYHKDGDEFEILPGHVKLLEKIVSFINLMTELHGPEFFDPRVVKPVRKPEPKVMTRTNRIRGFHKTPGATTQTQTIIVVPEPKSSHALDVSPTTQPQTIIVESQPQSSHALDVSPTTQIQTVIAEPQTESNNVLNAWSTLPEEYANPSLDKDNEVGVQSDGSLEKFIAEERVHLVDLIRKWMEKNVRAFFEQYSDQLIPDILEAVMEKSSTESEELPTDNDNAEANDLMVLVFRFSCPLCGKKIRVTQQPNKNGEAYFSLSNVERHWKIHAEENQPKKAKKPKAKKNVSAIPRTRNLRSKESLECDTKKEGCNEVEYEVLTDEEEDGSPSDFKIVKRKTPSRKN